MGKKMKTRKTFKEAALRMQMLIERFRSEAKGVAALEFAIIAPLLIMLFFATLEVSTLVSVNRKVSRVSSTVGDLITQSQTLTANDVQDIMRSATYVMEPYDHTVKIVISGIEIESGAAKVIWSCSQNTSALPVGSIYTVPTKIKKDGTFLVASNVNVTHTPMIAFYNVKENAHGVSDLETDTSAVNMEEEIFLRPRVGSSISLNC